MIGSRRRKIYLRGAPRGPRPGPVGKTAVWGAVERGGRVTARVMPDTSSFSILSNVRSRIIRFICQPAKVNRIGIYACQTCGFETAVAADATRLPTETHCSDHSAEYRGHQYGQVTWRLVAAANRRPAPMG